MCQALMQKLQENDSLIQEIMSWIEKDEVICMNMVYNHKPTSSYCVYLISIYHNHIDKRESHVDFAMQK